MSALKDLAPKNISCMSVTLDTSHLEMSALKKVAPTNIFRIVVTRDTSQLEMSLLKRYALLNTSLMSVTRDTSHSPIGPCGLSLPSPSDKISRYLSTALWSSSLDRGENTGGTVVQTFGDIDPGDPSNISNLVAFE